MSRIGKLAAALCVIVASVLSSRAQTVVPRVTLQNPAIDDQDDMCIWVHPTDASLGAVVVSDKFADRIFVYDLAGNVLQTVIQPTPGNIDVRYGFDLDGRPIDIVACNDRANQKILVYEIRADTRQLTRVDDGAIETGPNYGSCLYRSYTTGRFHSFSVAQNGVVTQSLLSGKGGTVSGTLVRSWDIGSQTEGCVADDEQGVVFFGEENVGIWRVGAEPGDPTTGTLIAQVGDASALQADVEGLAIYYAANGGGYLIASSQGSDEYKVYDRQSPHAFVKTFRVSGVTGTDGLDVINVDLGLSFPMGLLAVHNSTPAKKTVELCGYEDLGLDIDTTYWDPRDFMTTAVTSAVSWTTLKGRYH